MVQVRKEIDEFNSELIQTIEFKNNHLLRISSDESDEDKSLLDNVGGSTLTPFLCTS